MLPLPLLPVCVQLIFFFRPFRNRPLRSLISEKVARRQVGKQPFFWRRSGPEVLHLDLREKADPEVGGKAEIGLRRWGSRPAGPATQQTVKSGPLVLFSPVSPKKKKEERTALSYHFTDASMWSNECVQVGLFVVISVSIRGHAVF